MAQVELHQLQDSLQLTRNDSTKSEILLQISTHYSRKGIHDSALIYIDSGLVLAKKYSSVTLEIDALNRKARNHYSLYNDSLAKLYAWESIQLAKRSGSSFLIANNYILIGAVLQEVGDYQQGDSLLQEAVQLGKSTKDSAALANAYNNLAIGFDIRGQADSAIFYYQKALLIEKLRNAVGNYSRISNNIGVVKETQGKYLAALNHYFDAIRVREQAGDTSGAAFSYENIGNAYLTLEDYEQSLHFLQKALAINKAYNKFRDMASNQILIGKLYMRLEQYDNAKMYFQEALKIAEQYKLKSSKAFAYTYIGAILFQEDSLEQANNMIDQALHIAQEVESQETLIECKIYKAKILHGLKQSNLALKRAKEAYSLALQSQSIDALKDASEILNKLYVLLGDYKRAHEYAQLYHHYHDSIFNDSKAKKLGFLEAEMAFTKKEEEAKAKREREMIMQQEEALRNRQFRNFLILVLLIATVLLFFVYRGFRLAKKALAVISVKRQQIADQNEELIALNTALNEQKEEISLQKNRITDSINSALRIQTAMLPSEENIQKALPQSFVLYRPKDIVSGDFYWHQEVEGKHLIAAIDCTGHGVPGAMMSMLGYDLLDKIVNGTKVVKPNLILDELNEEISKMLKQNDGQSNEGMDMALLSYDPLTQELQFAGAKNPLVIIQNGALEVIKGDRFPIGGRALLGQQDKKHAVHTLKVVQSTTIYLYSDGYQDQFGGERFQKFMAKKFRALLLEISNYPIHQQKVMLQQRLDQWQGTNKQTDDILVIGIQLH
ncbi:MAG: tetratricopeptide repeat protein [Flammeovirgaceae bacterium]